MDNFAEGQRWISEMEPELGLGTVLHLEAGRVQLFFPASGEMRMYASANAPLKRVRFRVGDTIVDHENNKYVVRRVDEEGPLITYSGDGWSIPETLLSDSISFHTAEDRLLHGQFDDRAAYRLRQKTLQMQHSMRSSDVRGFLGGRIDLIPHQLYIAHEICSRQAPRVLLADEVGLGKTIEACLIIHRLLMSGRARRVLIVVPESLVHQWFVEMLRRFNLWFHIYDEERSAALEGEDEAMNPFLDDQLVLCSREFLVDAPKRGRQAIDAGWDMLVVDEAHHLEWSSEGASPAYELVEQLSEKADGLLLLTATPVQLGREGHFARLRLLDPDRYSSFEAYLDEEEQYRDIARLAETLDEGGFLTEEDVSLLAERSGAGRSSIASRMDAIRAGDDQERARMVQDLLDIHGTGRVMFRNTRAAIQGFPGRTAHLIPLEPETDAEAVQERIAREFFFDAAPQATSPRYKFANDPRLAWLVQWIKDNEDTKALLICRSKEKALGLQKALLEAINVKVGVFHENLSLVQRDRNAAWFAEEDGARLLISSEIGSEGRNFQFVHHLILFDLPQNPELLEQRIGRLDRIGQTETIQIHVPYLSGSPQELLARWYHEGLNAFEESLLGGTEIMRAFGQDVLDLAAQRSEEPGAGEKAFKNLLKQTKAHHKTLRQTLNEGRNRLLEMNSFRPRVAEEVIRLVQKEDRGRMLESYMQEVFESYGMQSDEIAPRTYRVVPGPAGIEAFPSISDGGASITFDRSRALVREDIGFLTWDHPMVAGSLDLVLGSEKGNCTFATWPDRSEEDLWMEVSFVLEAIAESQLHVDRFLSPTPIRVLVNFDLDDLSDTYPSDALEPHLAAGDPDPWLGDEGVTPQQLTDMMDKAHEIAEDNASTMIEQSLDRMRAQLDYEIERLRALQAVNTTVRPEELQAAEDQKKALTHAILRARLRVDSLRLIGMPV